MLKLFSVISLIVVLAVIGLAGEVLSTGELIDMQPDVMTDWPPAALARPDLDLSYFTEHFKIHYTVEGINAVYESDIDEDPADGYPDYVNRMGEYLEISYNVYINNLSYDIPPPDNGLGGDDLYDIYVTTIEGSTVPELPSDYYPGRDDFIAYSFIGNDLRSAEHPDDPLPLLMHTCAHEYFHAVQMAYRGYTAESSGWWYELSANWAVERVFDDLNEVYYYLPYYYNKISNSIYQTGGTHMYGAWVYAEYLSQNHTLDLIKDIFVTLININRATDAIALTLDGYDLDIGTEFTTYSVWNYFTQDNYVCCFFDEGEQFPVTVPIVTTHQSYPTGWLAAPKYIQNLGIAYIEFQSNAVDKTILKIEFEVNEDESEMVAIAVVFPDRPIVIKQYTTAPEEHSIFIVENFHEAEKAIMAVNWPFSGYLADIDSVSFSYCAYLDTVTAISEDYQENIPDGIIINGNYPNPFNSSTNIIFNWNKSGDHYNIFIYDITGREIDRLAGFALAGSNKVGWNASNNLASGTYLYKIAVGRYEEYSKMLFVK